MPTMAPINNADPIQRMTNMKVENTEYYIDVDQAIADAKAARDAYLAEIFSSLFAKIKVALTSKKADKLVAAH